MVGRGPYSRQKFPDEAKTRFLFFLIHPASVHRGVGSKKRQVATMLIPFHSSTSEQLINYSVLQLLFACVDSLSSPLAL